MTELALLAQARVTQEEIDQNGHMNLLQYARHAGLASMEFAARLGLTPERLAALGTGIFITDSFAYHHRELMQDTPFTITGATLSAAQDRLLVFLEIHNADTTELAAAFTHQLVLCDLATRRPEEIPSEVIVAAGAYTTAWPPYGRPRTLKFPEHGPNVSMQELERRGLGTGMMGIGTAQPIPIPTGDCDAFGYLRVMPAIPLGWRQRLPTRAEIPPAAVIFMRLARERGIGWVSIESRNSLHAFVRADEQLKVFSALVSVGRKSRHRKTWTFAAQSGRLLATTEQVELAFNIKTRRTIDITPELAAANPAEFQPDLI